MSCQSDTQIAPALWDFLTLAYLPSLCREHPLKSQCERTGPLQYPQTPPWEGLGPCTG